MPMFMAAGALAGGIGGAIKKGPKMQLSALGQEGQASSLAALQAYRNLVGVGPNATDVSASLDASRGFANQLNNISSSGLYDMAAGNRLAQQQFGGQRQAMEQQFQDQMTQANRSAAMSGRSSNDPILRARLAQEQSRQSAMLNAQQSSAAVDLGRQSTTDMLGLQGQRVGLLQGLSDQAFGNQQNLFGMGSSALQQDFGRQLASAQYEQSRGGGIGGALTGMAAGAGAGAQMGQGMNAMSNQSAWTNAGIQQMQQQQRAPMQSYAPSPMMQAPMQQGWPSMPLSAPQMGVSSPQMLGLPSSAPQYGVSSPRMLGPVGVYAPGFTPGR